MIYDSQGIAKRGDWFVVRRPNGRCSRFMFASKYRAAEHAEAAFKTRWPDLAARGYRIAAKGIDA